MVDRRDERESVNVRYLFSGEESKHEDEARVESGQFQSKKESLIPDSVGLYISF